jgi:hypothetical protein
MSRAPLLSPHSEDFIHCHVAGVTRPDFLKIVAKSGYPMENSIVADYDPQGIMMNPHSFENEADFIAEHQSVVSIAKRVYADATVQSFYYEAGEYLPKYEQPK